MSYGKLMTQRCDDCAEIDCAAKLSYIPFSLLLSFSFFLFESVFCAEKIDIRGKKK